MSLVPSNPSSAASTRPGSTLLASTLLASTLLAAACAAPGEPSHEDTDPAFLFPRPNHATLVVARARSVSDDGCAYIVAIDSSIAGHLAQGGWITMYPTAGTHVLSLRPIGAGCPSGVDIRTRLEAERQLRLHIVRTATGALRWESGDVPR